MSTPKLILTNHGNMKEIEPYTDSWEHISDEFRRLHLLINIELLKQQDRQYANPLEQFKGLVVSEEEIGGLLSEMSNSLEGDKTLNVADAEKGDLIESLRRLESNIRERCLASLSEGVHLSLPFLSRLFHLDPFEEKCLFMCLAPEIDLRYEKLYAYLQDDVTRKKPTVDLVLRLLCRTTAEKLKARRAFDSRAPLMKYRLLQMNDYPEGSVPLLSRFIKLDDRIVNFLLGLNVSDVRLDHFTRLVLPRSETGDKVIMDESQISAVSFVRSHFNEIWARKKSLLLYFHGAYGSGKMRLAELICREMGLPLIVADMERIQAAQLPIEEAAWLLGRESLLQRGALCIENFDSIVTEDGKQRLQLNALFEMIRSFSTLTFLLGNRTWQPRGLFRDHDRGDSFDPVFFELEFPVPDDNTRKVLWERYMDEGHRFAGGVDLGELAGKFRFTPGQIMDAIIVAENLACLRSQNEKEITMADLYAGCRAQSNQKLGTLTRKIEPRHNWDDIVLPPSQLTQLREICNQVKYRHKVYGEWGFDRKLSYGKGLNALFSGPSGTGKTMAAEIISDELGLDLYKIDLAQVVSKYIGETEKNLDKIFTEARTSYAILFFDEADALFGKRSEVKDAHDRYANIEIGYLLQKMEEYDGIAILATNLRQNMDEAFVRRIQVIIEFPFPDEEHRGQIWKVIFPPQAPIGNNVDLGVLAREVKLAGGNIKNIALTAAFYAAEGGGVIQMSHLLEATRREYQKLGRIWNESDWGSHGKLVS